MEDKVVKERVLLITNGNLFARIILDKFLKNYSGCILQVIIVNGDYYGNKGMKAFFNYFVKTTPIYFIYKAWTLVLIKLLKLTDSDINSSVEGICREKNIQFRTEPNINSESLFADMKNLKPTSIVSVSCPQLIKEKWLELVNHKAINIHSSLLPKYAGLAPYYWVLVNNESKTGTTVHYMVKGFDKGNILAQEKANIDNRTSSFSLFLHLSEIGGEILIQGFKKMICGEVGKFQDKSIQTYYSNPTFRSYLKLKSNGFSLFKLGDLKKIKNKLNRIS